MSPTAEHGTVSPTRHPPIGRVVATGDKAARGRRVAGAVPSVVPGEDQVGCVVRAGKGVPHHRKELPSALRVRAPPVVALARQKPQKTTCEGNRSARGRACDVGSIYCSSSADTGKTFQLYPPTSQRSQTCGEKPWKNSPATADPCTFPSDMAGPRDRGRPGATVAAPQEGERLCI